MQPVYTLSVVAWVMSTITTTVAAQEADWAHPYCQYRFVVDVDIPRPGWTVIPLSERDICQAIGRLEEYSFDPTFLAYNHVRVCEFGATGRAHTPLPKAGFHLVVDPSELVKQDPSLPIPTSNRDYYLVRFTSEGGRFPPTVGYEQVFPVGLQQTLMLRPGPGQQPRHVGTHVGMRSRRFPDGKHLFIANRGWEPAPLTREANQVVVPVARRNRQCRILLDQFRRVDDQVKPCVGQGSVPSSRCLNHADTNVVVGQKRRVKRVFLE